MLKYILVFLTLIKSYFGFPQEKFSAFFENKSLRMDYIHAGTENNSSIYLKEFREEPFWGGSKFNLTDTFKYGDYLLEMYDSVSGQLIYSRGYNTLFKEWQTTEQANHLQKSFYESVVMPYPVNTVRIVIQKRNRQLQFENFYEIFLNPHNLFIRRDPPPSYKTHQIVYSGDPSQKLDIVFLSDGYTSDEMPKFIADVKRFAGDMQKWKPYNKLADKINVWAVEAPSQESGTDFPEKNIWKNTVLNSEFYTFNIERYLTTEDYKTVRDIASCVPYDQICILVNTDKYGGGGIYNFYTLFAANNTYSEYLFMHEFGHGFVCLADEYYDPDVAYHNYYNIFTEPYEANITTLINFKSKWQDMVSPGVPVPTPADSIYFGKVGAFEGAGYMAKGIYRPAWDCSMRSVSFNNFCPACRRAIRQMVEFYAK
jgi:hypothetical protein